MPNRLFLRDTQEIGKSYVVYLEFHGGVNLGTVLFPGPCLSSSSLLALFSGWAAFLCLILCYDVSTLESAIHGWDKLILSWVVYVRYFDPAKESCSIQEQLYPNITIEYFFTIWIWICNHSLNLSTLLFTCFKDNVSFPKTLYTYRTRLNIWITI